MFKSNCVHYENFVAYIKTRAYKGLNNYTSPVKEFLIWTESSGIIRVNDLSSELLNKYYQHLISRPNKRNAGSLSQSSIYGHFHALNLFFELLLLNGSLKQSFVLPSFNKADKKQREILSPAEIIEIRDNCINPFERNLINIGYGCGLRRSEMVNLNVQDVLFAKGYLIVKEGKNGKRREVPMTDAMITEAKDYIFNFRPLLLGRSDNVMAAFFINGFGQRSNGNALNAALKKIIRRTGNSSIINKNISLHSLRHSIATHLQEAGAGLEFIRDFLGHSEIDTSLIYLVRRKKRITIL